jgi:glycosyltransferase involved in cell wall biosynthesis
MKRVDANVVPSRFLVEVFSGFGIDATVVPNIVDVERFRFRERDPLRPRLLSTRNFEALYNVAATLRAFRIVQQTWPDASLTLVGGGGQEHELRALVGRLELRHVTFAGRVAPDAIADYYADHDIYLQSPDIDNMPTSLLEAFASGMPVVSTEAGGVPAILTNGVHGLLAPLGDHEALARHVLRLLAAPDEARVLARAARATCDACTWPMVRELWLRAYRDAIVSRQQRGNRAARTAAPQESRGHDRLSPVPPSSAAERSR